MTAAQHRVYSAIKVFIEQNGFSPSYHKIMAATGLRSLATVSKHVHNLVEEGYLMFSGKNGHDGVVLVPQKLYGFRECQTGHERLFYSGRECPCCKIILGSARQVTVDTKHTNS